MAIRREGAKLPRSARVYAESAYQGYEREHAAVEVPYKKRKGGDLRVEEMAHNRGLGSFRVAIEHRIGRTKRLRIVAECYRNPRHTHPTKTSIIAALVNIEAGFRLI